MPSQAQAAPGSSPSLALTCIDRYSDSAQQPGASRQPAASTRWRNISTRARHALALSGLLALLVPLPGCQSITGSPNIAQIRLVDASPDAPALDAYQGTSILVYNLGLGSVTSYISVTPGTYNIIADAAGTRQALATQSGTFNANGQYTVLIGNYSAGLQETILKDQSQAAPTGQIAIRVLDQSVVAGAVDLYLIPSGSTILTVRPALTNVSFGSNSGYVNVPAGTYTLVALPAGTTPTATGSTFYTGPSVTYASGAARTIILVDQQLSSTPGIQVITAADYDPVAGTS